VAERTRAKKPQDATLRNVRAAKKRTDQLTERLEALELYVYWLHQELILNQKAKKR
jgi:hypothetical protein